LHNTAPEATFTLTGPVRVGTPTVASFSGQTDPSTADTTAGFRYSYDFDNDGIFEIADVPDAARSNVFTKAGEYTVRGRIKDKDGDSTTYTVTVGVFARFDFNAGGLTSPGYIESFPPASTPQRSATAGRRRWVGRPRRPQPPPP
jgi:hypothetical protein